MKDNLQLGISGAIAGAVNGLFGAGGGMLLVPLLSRSLDEEEVFPSSVSIILPVCVVSLLIGSDGNGLPFRDAFPYLLGGSVGGLIAGLTANKIPVKWLHRLLGILILWGGIRYLC